MRRRPRWVVDTNVLVSAFLWRGIPGRVIDLAGEKEVQLYTSRALLDELAATLAKKKLSKHVTATGMTADQLLVNYRRIATLVTARRLDQQVSRDADDDVVLACALASCADLIVSGDNELLDLPPNSSATLPDLSATSPNARRACSSFSRRERNCE